MARYIDADAAIEAIKRPHGGCYTEEAKAFAVYQVLSVPTSDVVEVVRCRDCKFYDEAERMCNDTNGFDRYWKPTDFCSYGERRADDDRNG